MAKRDDNLVLYNWLIGLFIAFLVLAVAGFFWVMEINDRERDKAVEDREQITENYVEMLKEIAEASG